MHQHDGGIPFLLRDHFEREGVGRARVLTVGLRPPCTSPPHYGRARLWTYRRCCASRSPTARFPLPPPPWFPPAARASCRPCVPAAAGRRFEELGMATSQGNLSLRVAAGARQPSLEGLEFPTYRRLEFFTVRDGALEIAL